MFDAQDIAPDRVRPLTRGEYGRLVELGVFDDEKVELLEGALVTMSPQGTRHASTILRLTYALHAALDATRFQLRVQSPLATTATSEPEPDLAVVDARADFYQDEHPHSAHLVIEVAETSINKDRQKASVYAAAGVTAYWIVNLADDVVEFHEEPSGESYTSSRILGRGDTLAAPALDLVLEVADVLPEP